MGRERGAGGAGCVGAQSGLSYGAGERLRAAPSLLDLLERAKR